MDSSFGAEYLEGIEAVSFGGDDTKDRAECGRQGCTWQAGDCVCLAIFEFA